MRDEKYIICTIPDLHKLRFNPRKTRSNIEKLAKIPKFQFELKLDLVIKAGDNVEDAV